MNKEIKFMKTRLMYVLFFICAGILFQACEKNTTDYYEVNSGLKIDPENPKAGDEIFILEEICSYELLNPLVTNENTITYTRHYNFYTKQPCLLLTDTVSLGQLEEGYYTIKYILINDSDLENESGIGIDTIHFYVSSQ